MNKLLLLITLVSLCACESNTVRRLPKYRHRQEVLFNVGYYYSGVCSGKGAISSWSYDSNGDIIYSIETEETYCPEFRGIHESEITPLEWKEKTK